MAEEQAFQSLAEYEVDTDEQRRERYERVEREVLLYADPLARMIQHKRLAYITGKSAPQVTRELSLNYENSLSLKLFMAIGDEAQHDKLVRPVICDGLRRTFGEWISPRKPSDKEELRALKDELRELGSVGETILQNAKRRARSGR